MSDMANDERKARIHAAHAKRIADDDPIIELIGPPMAYFEVMGEPTDDGQVHSMIRVEYKTLHFKGKDGEIVKVAMQTALEDIREALRTYDCFRIIWWRQQIERRHDPDPKRGYTVYSTRCRIATTPILSHEFWSRHATPEGALARWVE